MTADAAGSPRIEVAADLDRCCGSGQCARTLPQVFDQRPSDGRVRVLVPSPPAELLARLKDVEYLCPVQALSVNVYEATGGS